MVVLHLLKTSTAASWALRQMEELVKLGVKVHVILPKGGALYNEYRRVGVVPHPFQPEYPVLRPWLWHKHLSQFRKIVSTIRPDIIHSHFMHTTLTMRLAQIKGQQTPRIFQVPGPLHLENRASRYVDLLSARKNDYWIATSKIIKNSYLRAGISSERIYEAAYCPDIKKFEPANRESQKSRLGITPETMLVGMIAYFYPPRRLLGQRRGIKGHEDLINAIQLLCLKRNDIMCMLVGGPYKGREWYMKELMEYANKKCGNKIIFTGEVDHVPEFLGAFDVAVVASHSENFGGTGEALLMEVPTVATNVGGIPDLICNGETGWLVPPKDPTALATAILDALDRKDYARQLAARGRERVLALYDPQVNARKIYQIYRWILTEYSQASVICSG